MQLTMAASHSAGARDGPAVRRGRKYRARSPRSANALAANTRYALSVIPKIAGMESRANTMSTDKMATTTTSSGVAARRPLSRVKQRVALISGSDRHHFPQEVHGAVVTDVRFLTRRPQ